MEINKQLNEYHVEYNVLQEEMTSSNHHMEMLKKEQAQNRHLETQLQVWFSFFLCAYAFGFKVLGTVGFLLHWQ